MEKPFTVNATEAETLLDMARAAGRRITVGHNLQFSPEALRMRQLVAGGLPRRPARSRRVHPVLLAHGDAVLMAGPCWAIRITGSAGCPVRSCTTSSVTVLPRSQSSWRATRRNCSRSASPVPTWSATVTATSWTRCGPCCATNAGTTAFFLFTTQFGAGSNELRLFGKAGNLVLDNTYRTVLRVSPSRHKSYLRYLLAPLSHAREQARNSLISVRQFARKEFQMDFGMRKLMELFYRAIRERGPDPIPPAEILRARRRSWMPSSDRCPSKPRRAIPADATTCEVSISTTSHSSSEMTFLIVDDIPTPWREPVYERVHDALGGDMHVVHFKQNEKRRLWTFPLGRHPKTFLDAITLNPSGKERFLNPGVVPLLLRQRPRVAVVFASTKNPSVWLTLGLCRLLGTRVALLSDTWLGRDRDISGFQRWARRVVYNRCGDAFVGASRETLSMFRHYNPRILDEQCFLSHLVADNGYFERRLAGRPPDRRFDVMFSGRIVEGKNPIFFAQVCAGIKARLGSCRALIIGDGDERLKAGMRDVFTQHGVTFEFAGFIPHAELPEHYASARLLLLPTSADCWGVVINEAMIARTPVITTEWTAAAGELVLDGQNGQVLPLEAEAWAAAASELLADRSRWETFSERAHATAAEFNYDRAAAGILDAFAYLRARSQQAEVDER